MGKMSNLPFLRTQKEKRLVRISFEKVITSKNHGNRTMSAFIWPNQNRQPLDRVIEKQETNQLWLLRHF